MNDWDTALRQLAFGEPRPLSQWAGHSSAGGAIVQAPRPLRDSMPRSGRPNGIWCGHDRKASVNMRHVAREEHTHGC
jgi:hypothetical protein